MTTCPVPSSATAAATRNAVPYLTSSGAPWPGADLWRPAGWRTGLAPAEVMEALSDLSSGKAEREAPWHARGVLLPAVKADAALLRDCWATPLWTWEVAAEIVGPPQVDPFWNPWSAIHERWAGVRLLDGREGRDGFDPAARGAGTSYDNWPHSDNSRGMAALSAHVRAGNRAAAVAPLDGAAWVQGAVAPSEGGPVVADLLSADLVVLLGRVRFRPPPGVPESSPRGAYVLALWGVEPGLVRDLAGSRLWVPEAQREIVFLAGCGDGGKPVSPERAAALAAAARKVAQADET